MFLSGEGDRVPNDNLRLCWKGVEGTELEWRALRCGR